MLNQSPPEILYHYTTEESLIKILEGQKGQQDGEHEYVLWATKIQYMNDAAEFIVPLRMAGEILQQKESEASPTCETQRNVVRAMRRAIEDSENVNIGVVCFSKHRDWLGQWRAYCRDSLGYAIGFAASKLLPHDPIPTGKLTLAECEYLTETQQRSRITGLISECMSSTSTSNQIPLVYRLMKMALTMKDSSFGEEDEWRIVLSDISGAPDLMRFNYLQCHFRPGRSMLIPHWNVPFDLSAIKEIWIGPTPHPTLAKKALEGLLVGRGLGEQVRVENSRIPYRNW